MRFGLVNDMDKINNDLNSGSSCHNIDDEAARNACYGNEFVYRVGFALVLFFSVMTLLVVCCRKAAHDGAWMLKTLVIVATVIGSLWIPDNSMDTFSNVCLYGSAIFIVIQVLIMLEWVYAFNESWRDKAQEDEVYFSYLLAVTVVGYVLSLVFVILSIVFFAAPGCAFAAAEISWTCIACFLLSLLSISGINDNSSLLCSSMMTLYCTYYCWSALSGMPLSYMGDDGHSCNKLSNGTGAKSVSTWINIIVGLGLTAISVAGSAYSGGTGNIGFTSEHTVHKDEESAYEAMDDDNEEKFGGSELILPLVTYHVVMLLASMFMVMTIVNWDVNKKAESAKLENFGTGETVMWSKTLSQWLVIVLYLWTIVAPRCIQMCGVEREFDFS